MRDMLIQDKCAGMYLSSARCSGNFSSKDDEPDTYLARTVCPKDIDILVPMKMTTSEIRKLLLKAIERIDNVEVGLGRVCLDNTSYILGDYVDQVSTFACVYRYGGFASLKTMRFKVDVITLKEGEDYRNCRRFQKDCPFSSDSYVAFVEENLKSSDYSLCCSRSRRCATTT